MKRGRIGRKYKNPSSPSSIFNMGPHTGMSRKNRCAENLVFAQLEQTLYDIFLAQKLRFVALGSAKNLVVLRS
jgi:hypothetical protein